MVKTEDVVALVRVLVQQNTTTHAGLSGQTLAAHVGGRVFAPALVDADAATVERPCIVVDCMGGGANYGGAVQQSTVYLYAYSDAGQGQASAIYDALYSIMQAARLYDPAGAITLAGYAREEQRPICGHNSAMKSFYSRGMWALHTAG